MCLRLRLANRELLFPWPDFGIENLGFRVQQFSPAVSGGPTGQKIFLWKRHGLALNGLSAAKSRSNSSGSSDGHRFW